MADITIQAPFTILLKGDVYVDALPSDHKAVIKVDSTGISKFEYQRSGSTYTLPTGGKATSTAATDSADLDSLGDVDTDTPPQTPFTISFNSGTLSREPASGSPYKVKIVSVDADMKVTAAASPATYGSGGIVFLDGGGSGSPTRRTP